MKYTRNILKRIGRTVAKHNLLAGNDKVLVALSGGKDSFVLLEALAECRKNLPFHIELFAVHILVEGIGYKADINYLESFCKDLSTPFIFRETMLDESKGLSKGICFLCSWQRRKILFNLTRELGCNKLAFGHHMDDALETLLMNMVYHGSVSSIPYSLNMFGGRVSIIRPLLELTNHELEKFALINEYQTLTKTCPYGNSKRKDMAGFIEQLSLQHKRARKNIFRSLSNFYPEYLPNYRK
jgi:tRNA 2-thiocytidine biosynthesis protein TtcA